MQTNKKNTIALIDDDDIYKFTAKRTIEKSNLVKRIFFFSDGKEAITFFEKNVNDNDELPDMIFLDLNMPIMDGWQFLEEYILLKPRISKPITIYIVTSSMNPDDFIKAKSISEVSDYIIKPITGEKFKGILDTISSL